MGNYFKDKNFHLFFMASKNGVPIQFLPRFFFDETTGQSQVVAVRGGPMSRDDFYNNKVEVDMPDAKSKFWMEKDLCDYLCSLNEDSLKEFQLRSVRNATALEEIKLHWADVTVEKAVVLCYSDGSSLEQLENELKGMNLDFQLIKIGGSELAVEFLLTDFCVTAAFRKKLKPEFESWVDLIVARPEGNEDPDFGYEEGYDWSISTLGTIEAPEYFEDFDDGDFYKSSPRLYYYCVDLNALGKLHEQLHVPYRVEKILTDEQRMQLKAEAPSILLEELDYIARKVFKQPVDDFKDDQHKSYMAARAAAWNADMYEVLGGDGSRPVYLSEGVSISPSGKLVDD